MLINNARRRSSPVLNNAWAIGSIPLPRLVNAKFQWVGSIHRHWVTVNNTINTIRNTNAHTTGIVNVWGIGSCHSKRNNAYQCLFSPWSSGLNCHNVNNNVKQVQSMSGLVNHFTKCRRHRQ